MKYFNILLIGIALSLGTAFSTSADNSEIETHYLADYHIAECEKTVKTSKGWSFKSEEETIKGPCDIILE